jgi:hypothetical protein
MSTMREAKKRWRREGSELGPWDWLLYAADIRCPSGTVTVTGVRSAGNADVMLSFSAESRSGGRPRKR